MLAVVLLVHLFAVRFHRRLDVALRGSVLSVDACGRVRGEREGGTKRFGKQVSSDAARRTAVRGTLR